MQAIDDHKMTLTRRTAMLSVGGTAVFGVLASRLYYLQVIRAQDYISLSENNRFNFKITLPSRGITVSYTHLTLPTIYSV